MKFYERLPNVYITMADAFPKTLRHSFERSLPRNFEKAIQTGKRTLKKVIGRSCLSFEELHTLLVEVEGIVNARPLTYLYEDLDGINFALTPSHLINGRRLQNTPISSHSEIASTHESLT